MYTLDEVQKRLDERGICDIKIFRVDNCPPDILEGEIVEILGMYLDGHVIPLGLLGDKPLTHKD